MTVLIALVLAVGVGYVVGRLRPPPGLPEMRDPMALVANDLDPPLNEPWMQTHPHAVEVPVAALVAICRPDDYVAAQRSQRPAHIARLVHEGGLERPLEVRFDRRGRVVLGDGHNRVVMALITGRPTLPAVPATVELIPSHAVPAERFFLAWAPEDRVGAMATWSN